MKSASKGYLLKKEEAFLKPCRMMCSCKNLSITDLVRDMISPESLPWATSTQSKLSLLIFTFLVFPRAPLLLETSLSQYICCKRSLAFPNNISLTW
ncbi:hypothetical protein LEP1GSC188_3086 [Leptospira weilii serovar Topaz str. LT2116]|uniref:Uncharacterized protein n=1 Tax=Leptospira weilii serovar Topaz str. LT2116 TaxID=1088540 RepID=M3EPD0_9LEPT|nr:hypothetical protein LEP1GSC188_0654 [Leptospira weilii serovar Topaz str. LT2116]EMF80348.1 hypothetical protein LEP1GSC188_1049 [Leptospira weilii serovar Topaz str. LT2116]EMF82903.1 hypothetical protein LEP1GSC188_3086 [Leptospira weilii serovar Topaz str. LT2116]